MTLPITPTCCQADSGKKLPNAISNFLTLQIRIRTHHIVIKQIFSQNWLETLSNSSFVIRDLLRMRKGSGCESGMLKNIRLRIRKTEKSHKDFLLTIFVWWWKDSELDPEPDPYLWLTDPDADPGGQETNGSGSPTMESRYEILYLKFGTAAQIENSERPVLHIGLHGGIIELSSDQPLSIEDGVRRVDGNLGKEQKDTFKKWKFHIKPLLFEDSHIVLFLTAIRKWFRKQNTTEPVNVVWYFCRNFAREVIKERSRATSVINK